MVYNEVAGMRKTTEDLDVIQVKCPCCKLRLFDMRKDADGIISIKCGRCRTVLAVKMHHAQYKCTEQIAARA